MFRNFKEFLNEKLDIQRREFAHDLISRMRNSKLPGGKFEDWWCYSGKEFDDEDKAYLENLERKERQTPESSRFVGEILMMEFQKKDENMTQWRLGRVDLRDFELTLNTDLKGPMGDNIDRIFKETLKEHFPAALVAKKFGL